MLDVMRQANRRKWFLYILILPVVFSFILAIFAVWGGAGDPGGGAAPSDWAARIDGEVIRVRDLELQRRQVENQLRAQLGDQYETLAPNFNLEQLALGQILGRTLAYQEAHRLGLTASDAEIGEAIRSAPVFQSAGGFIGRNQYLNELKARGYDVVEYEQEVGRELAVQKLRDLIGSMVSLTDADVDRAYLEEGETAEVDYVLFREADYAASSEPSPRDLETWFQDHRGDYRTPERRRVAYALIAREPLMSSAQVSEEEIRQQYEANRTTRYQSPEQWRASHILFKVPDGATSDQSEAIRARAGAVLNEVRAGGDFGSLAAQHSEDTSGPAGGDLGWFPRGRMVPEFERAAEALSDGQVSDLVRTSFGFHIIQLTGHRPAGTRPLEEVRDQLRQELVFRSAQEQLQAKATELSRKLQEQTSSFEATARELGYEVKETGLISREEPIGDMGEAPFATDALFRLEEEETSGPINAPQGVLFGRILEVKSPEPAPFDQVRDKVREDYLANRALERARAAARELAAAGADRFKETADRKKIEITSIGEFTRASAPAIFGDAAKQAIFSRQANEVAGPVEVSGGVVVAKIIKRGPTSTEEEGQVRRAVRENLNRRSREEAFSALLQRLERDASIELNQELLASLGRRAAR